MFKKKAFLISLALLASNFLLPNEVKSGLEIGEEIIYETEVNNNFTIRNRGSGYEVSAAPFPLEPLCTGDTLNELEKNCLAILHNAAFHSAEQNNVFLMMLFTKEAEPLIKGEQVMEVDEEIKYEEELDLIFKISRSTNGYKGSLTFWGFTDEYYCEGETLNELKLDCRIESGNDKRWILKGPLDSAIHELIDPLIEEEEDIEDEQEIEEDVVVEEEVEEVEEVLEEETAEAEDIDFDSITVESLPYSVDCPPKNKDLKIKQNKNEKFVVRFASGKRFYRGLDFNEALDVFEETYEDKCVE